MWLPWWWSALSWVVSDEEPWGVQEQLDMEQQYLYLECAEEDKRRGQHKVANQEVKPGRCWVMPLLNPAIQNLFLHNNHWKDKHVVTVQLCGVVRQGRLNQRAKVGCVFCRFGKEEAETRKGDAMMEDRQVEWGEPGVLLPVQTFYENEHDGRHRHDQTLNQDIDNQDETSYSLKTHKEKTENLIYEHDIDVKMENKDTQMSVESYNQECDETDTHEEIYFEEHEQACD